MRLTASSAVAMSCLLAGCSTGNGTAPAVARGSGSNDVREFLDMYNEMERRLGSVAAEAHWRSVSDVTGEHTGERIGADRALAAFRGSRYVIEKARTFLNQPGPRDAIEFAQLDNILLAAAESPGTIPDIVNRRIEAEARLEGILNGFVYCAEPRAGKCARPVSSNEIDDVLLRSRNLAERRAFWELSKTSGPPLKSGLAELRDLRNRVAVELGYSSYFHLQVADYGMPVSEMMHLMDRTAAGLKPLYEQLHLWTRRKLADRYKQPTPKLLPAHWLPDRWGQEWPGLVEGAAPDDLFRGRSPQWIVEQAERFYTSLGMPPLPKSFWEKSDLYQLPAGATRKKNAHASAWHLDYERDVRSLMNVIPNHGWFQTSHHELGHVYYYLAYSNPRIPVLLREGANRAFHEAVGDLIAIAAAQPAHLKAIGLMPKDREIDPVQVLLGEALNNVVFVPFAAGTMTHFEHDLYEKKLPPGQFNARWWEYAATYQGIEPPTPRGEEFCDACTKTHIIDDAAQYYDYAMASLIKYQLHDYIARKILQQDPHNCNYHGNKQVGKWLMEILSLGSTVDWRTLIKERTGEDLSPRAFIEYFKPLADYLARENPGVPVAR